MIMTPQEDTTLNEIFELSSATLALALAAFM